MNLGRPVSHLLVDLDGTLLGNRSLALGWDFMRQAMGRLIPYTNDWRRAARILIDINKEFRRVPPNIASSVTNDVRVVELFAKALKISAEESRRILRENVMAIFPGLEKHFYPIAGAKDFLDWAKGRHTLILATNPVWPPEIIEMRVRWAGIDPRIFTHITHVREMRACKPSPEYYRQILERHSLDAKDVMLIGNDMKMDLPATKLGIRVFIVGPFKEVTTIKGPQAKADAWKGPYAALRLGLDTGSGDILSRSNTLDPLNSAP